VLDAVVAGVPDERFGERVAAVVQLRPGTDAGAGAGGEAGPDASAEALREGLREHCRATIAGYKVPARIEFVPLVVRSPSGKADYPWAKRLLTGTG
jgi:3-oxocholest-4-en-26-oate---CoA ligase